MSENNDFLPKEYEQTVELLIKYEGFIKRQEADMRKMKDIEKIKIPGKIDFSKISGLSAEIIEKLKIHPKANLPAQHKIKNHVPHQNDIESGV